MARLGGIALALAISLTLVLPGCSRSKNPDNAIKVAAAASLSQAYEELAAAFTAETGRPVIITPSSSGKLAQQVIAGAPFDVFAAADVSWIDEAITQGGAVAETKRVYAFGRLALWTDGEPLEDVAALRAASLKKIAIANPETAPYGRAARQAMRAAGVWEAAKPRILYAGNVRQALQYAESGNAEVALTALSLVIEGEGAYTLIDDDRHAPLAQAIVATTRGQRGAAEEFIAFVDSEAGHAILRRYGLLQAGEALSAER